MFYLPSGTSIPFSFLIGIGFIRFLGTNSRFDGLVAIDSELGTATVF